MLRRGAGLYRRQRHLQGAALGRHEYLGALPQLHRIQRFGGQADAGGVSARLCVGGRGDLADRARPALARLVPKFHLHGLAHGEIADAAFRQGNGHFARAIGSQRVDGLAGGDHLPGLGLAAGDHPVGRGAQLRIGGLVAGHVEIGTGRVGLALRRLQRRVLRIQRRAADQLLFGQRGITLLVVAGAYQVGLGGGVLRLCRTRLQGIVGHVQLGQQLALVHALAGIHLTPQQVAADPERQRRFLAGTHLARIAAGSGHRRLRVNHPYRPRLQRRRFGLGAGREQGQQQGYGNPSSGSHGQDRKQGGKEWNRRGRYY